VRKEEAPIMTVRLVMFRTEDDIATTSVC